MDCLQHQAAVSCGFSLPTWFTQQICSSKEIEIQSENIYYHRKIFFNLDCNCCSFLCSYEHIKEHFFFISSPRFLLYDVPPMGKSTLKSHALSHVSCYTTHLLQPYVVAPPYLPPSYVHAMTTKRHKVGMMQRVHRVDSHLQTRIPALARCLPTLRY